MTELSFAKSYLTTLESRAIKIPTDYAIDLKVLELKGSITLPRMPQAMRKLSSSVAPGSTPALTIVLKSLRNPPLDLTLPAQSLTIGVLELKQAVATHVGLLGTDKIRLLYKKKPCADSKTVKELLGDAVVTDVELGVMIMGGVPSEEQGAAEKAARDSGLPHDAGNAVLNTPEFWVDLEGFLEQRVKSQEVAKMAAKMFEEVWRRKP